MYEGYFLGTELGMKIEKAKVKEFLREFRLVLILLVLAIVLFVVKPPLRLVIFVLNVLQLLS